MTPLTLEQFPAFFEACHGYAPFPWQVRLLGQALETGWPSNLTLPTASGKTSVLDVGVFALALQASLPPDQRTMPRRIALVVDRRVVVDDAAARAQKIRSRLMDPTAPPVVVQVAEALKALEGETPLEVSVLRGGIYRDERWARTPTQPTILLSTVDQVGSRLCHRGYGLSSGAWPIHAGLLSHDTLVVLDEAHCSRPFLATLTALKAFRATAVFPLPAPFSVVAMTATPDPAAIPFALGAEDRAHPALKQRLEARKLAQLILAPKKGEAGFTEALLEALRPMLGPGKTLGVVVNRVGTARRLLKALQAASHARKDSLSADTILLTGRCRAHDRDTLIAAHRERLAAGRDRSLAENLRPLVVVATQCIEVGADLDFDGMVTECAPLDSLRQRFGRLDRLGLLGTTPGAIVARTETGEPGKDAKPDPIYGSALALTWAWLQRNATENALDFGVDGLEPLLPEAHEERAALSAPSPQAPILFPAYLDLWAQTSPEPMPSPEVGVFLHGPDSGEPEVSLVWRADLEGLPLDDWAEAVSLCPPSSAECLPVRLATARKWLSREEAPEENDLEGGPAPEEDPKSESFRPALRWRGPEESTIALAYRELRPGDVLVIPATYGGCDAFGWDPESTDPVADLGDAVHLASRRVPVLRLTSALEMTWGEASKVFGSLPDLGPEHPDGTEDLLKAALQAVENTNAPEWLKKAAKALSSDKKRTLVPHPAHGMVVTASRRLSADACDSEGEGMESSLGAKSVPLDRHLEQVSSRAERYALACGLPPGLVQDVAQAARAHDLGKADPRFQSWLYGGNRLAALRDGLVAKSPRIPLGPAAQRIARERSGYPAGARHELLSVRLLESAPSLLQGAHDAELVLHLVVSHHGRCRPFAPVVTDPGALEVTLDLQGHTLHASSGTTLERLDSGVPERFWRLTRRYGWWGLSYLEAILRLSDHRVSEKPEEVTHA